MVEFPLSIIAAAAVFHKEGITAAAMAWRRQALVVTKAAFGRKQQLFFYCWL